MTQIQHEELSALLDGELDVRRTEVARAAIKTDPALQEEFEILAALDARLRNTADAAAFRPDITFPVATKRDISAGAWPAGAALVAVLLTVRFLPKLVELPWAGIALQLAVCIAISVVVMSMVRKHETDPLRAQLLDMPGGA